MLVLMAQLCIVNLHRAHHHQEFHLIIEWCRQFGSALRRELRRDKLYQLMRGASSKLIFISYILHKGYNMNGLI